MEDLNATVFSKSFKAPSAWAEREVKYKSERRDWDAAERKLRDRIALLEAENARYRADNKAAEFEARIQVIQPSSHLSCGVAGGWGSPRASGVRSGITLPCTSRAARPVEAAGFLHFLLVNRMPLKVEATGELAAKEAVAAAAQRISKSA